MCVKGGERERGRGPERGGVKTTGSRRAPSRLARRAGRARARLSASCAHVRGERCHVLVELEALEQLAQRGHVLGTGLLRSRRRFGSSSALRGRCPEIRVTPAVAPTQTRRPPARGAALVALEAVAQRVQPHVVLMSWLATAVRTDAAGGAADGAVLRLRLLLTPRERDRAPHRRRAPPAREEVRDLDRPTARVAVRSEPDAAGPIDVVVRVGVVSVRFDCFGSDHGRGCAGGYLRRARNPRTRQRVCARYHGRAASANARAARHGRRRPTSGCLAPSVCQDSRSTRMEQCRHISPAHPQVLTSPRGVQTVGGGTERACRAAR